MRKRILSLFLIIATSFTGFSQEFTLGLKAGANYSLGGTITGIQASRPFGFNVSEAESKLGFHLGAFGQMNLGKFFIRPEVVYTSLVTEFPFFDQKAAYTIQKLDIPLLVGYNVWGPIEIFAGPVYTSIIDAQLEHEEFANPITVQNTPINAQAGIKVEFGRFGIDLRYERNLSSPEYQRLDFNQGNIKVINEAEFNDPRLHQIILAVTFKIAGPGLNERKGRPCY